ncbi:TPA: hypothetical protein IAC10_01680 [Candidatus Scatousia excrementigallinarum]|uniref:Uncharacterized protein n=1 Tax=Candidatus Scatousia excrementigallinarum TaxID=2840935 RepID=A0A9D1JMM5_9BACT|nr:hypothetical protein [Candidatus Scatousia excrementigallinarum]
MGILTGGYLKMYTKKLQLQLQRQLTSVMLRHNKVQKQVGEMEKQLTRMQQNQNSVFNASMQAANYGAYQSIFGINPQTGQSSINANDAQAMQTANNQYQAAQQYNSIMFQQQKFMMDESFEQFRTMQLEPLQNLEESLAMEKASLESRLATIKEQHESAKEMEKDSRKDVVPDYTGQG